MVALSVLLVLCFMKWREHSPLNDTFIDVLQYSPNGYRLWTQFLIVFDQYPISFVALTYIIFAVTAWALYLGSRKEDRMMMFAWLFFVIYAGVVRQAPAFLLLGLAILLRGHKWSYLLVIPMTMVKEHAGLVYIIYLLAIRKYKEALGVGVLWAVTFFLVRLLIGPLDIYAGSVITPILTLQPYIVRLTWQTWLWIAGQVMLCVLFLKDRSEVLMVAANLPIITIFGLFFEPQLWLMVMVAIIYKRRVEYEEEVLNIER